MISASKKRWLKVTLASFMALALAASAKLQMSNPTSVAEAASRHRVTKQRTAQVAKAPAMTLAEAIPDIRSKREQEADPPATNLFAQKSWYVPPPPPPPPKPQPPPPPTAPPMPFSFLGSYQAPDKPLIIFLSKGDQLYTVSPGDIIEGVYRVEGIASGQLGFTYLPLNIRQTVIVSESS
jgi:hypothetical protein